MVKESHYPSSAHFTISVYKAKIISFGPPSSFFESFPDSIVLTFYWKWVKVGQEALLKLVHTVYPITEKNTRLWTFPGFVEFFSVLQRRWCGLKVIEWDEVTCQWQRVLSQRGPDRVGNSLDVFFKRVFTEVHFHAHMGPNTSQFGCAFMLLPCTRHHFQENHSIKTELAFQCNAAIART